MLGAAMVPPLPGIARIARVPFSLILRVSSVDSHVPSF